MRRMLRRGTKQTNKQMYDFLPIYFNSARSPLAAGLSTKMKIYVWADLVLGTVCMTELTTFGTSCRWSMKVWVETSRFLEFEISRFLEFEISRFPEFEISRFL